MKLSDFVATTITEIVRGVKTAQDAISDTDAEVHPAVKQLFLRDGQSQSAAVGYAHGGGLITMVHFDVGITVLDGKGTKAGIDIAAGILSVGAGGKSDHSKQEVSRIHFDVPLRLPRKQHQSAQP